MEPFATTLRSALIAELDEETVERHLTAMRMAAGPALRADTVRSIPAGHHRRARVRALWAAGVAGLVLTISGMAAAGALPSAAQHQVARFVAVVGIHIPDPTPGNDRTNPDHGATIPGNGGTNPGHGGTNPGNGGTNPGHGGTNPGNGGTNPGHGGTIPGNGGTNPGHGGTIPGNGGTTPGGTNPGKGQANAKSKKPKPPVGDTGTPAHPVTVFKATPPPTSVGASKVPHGQAGGRPATP